MIHAPNVPTADRRREQLRDAARSLESMVLKTLVTSSGVFSGGEGPGAAIRGDMFASTLADALSRGGGIGLAAQIERSLASTAGSEGPEELLSPHLAPAAFTGSTPVRSVRPRLDHPTASPSVGGSPAGAGALGGVPDPILPLAGRVSSPYGPRADPFTGDLRHHHGVDVAAPHGAEIRAARAGRVLSAGPRDGYGNTVEVDHGDGLTTLYAHASDLLVRPGDVVEAGATIARVGSTGRSTGPHLHFEVRQGGRPQDPGRALNEYRLRADDRTGAGSLPRMIGP